MVIVYLLPFLSCIDTESTERWQSCPDFGVGRSHGLERFRGLADPHFNIMVQKELGESFRFSSHISQINPRHLVTELSDPHREMVLVAEDTSRSEMSVFRNFTGLYQCMLTNNPSFGGSFKCGQSLLSTELQRKSMVRAERALRAAGRLCRFRFRWPQPRLSIDR